MLPPEPAILPIPRATSLWVGDPCGWGQVDWVAGLGLLVTSCTSQHQEQHSEGRSAPASEPHLIFVYEDRQILEDAAALISYYVARQPAIQKEDQATIQQLLRRFLPGLFSQQQPPPLPEPDVADEGSPATDSSSGGSQRKKSGPALQGGASEDKDRDKVSLGDAPAPEPLLPPPQVLDDVYSLFFANNNWYFFLRLHQTLCARLLRIYRQAQKQLLEHRSEKERETLLRGGRREKGGDPAMELRLKQPSMCHHNPCCGLG